MRAVRVDEVDLAVFEDGPRSAPTLVLVHGYPDTHAVWDGVAKILAEHFHVVTYDVRGAGASTAPRERSDYKLERLAADLRAVIEATAGGKPAHVVGHDWGSTQAWELVTDERARSLLASFTAISGPCLDHVGYWLRRGHGRASQVLKSWYIGAFHVPGLAETAWCSALVARAWPHLLARTEGVRDGASPTLAQDAVHGLELYRANMLDRLLAPRARHAQTEVQVIAPLADRFVGLDIARSASPWVTDLDVREIEGGHWIVRRHPARIARMVREMVDRVEGLTRPMPRRRPASSGGRSHEGRLVVITGAASGIGRATAIAFATRGACVVVADLDCEGAERTALLCRLLRVDAAAMVVDVSNEEAMARFAADVERGFGPPDIVVNNAGVGLAGAMLDMTTDDWRRVLGANLWGVIHGCRLFGAQMVARDEGGHIVNLASAAAFAPSAVLPAYATSKAAVLMLSECLRAELAPHGIGVSAICPGIIDTPITQGTTFVGVSSAEEARRRRASARLYRRRGVGPEAVASAIVRAVETNAAVVPVTIEAHALRAIGRFAPALARRLARVDPIRGTR